MGILKRLKNVIDVKLTSINTPDEEIKHDSNHYDRGGEKNDGQNKYNNKEDKVLSEREKAFYILELPHNATKGQIKKAYYKLSKKYHPDNFNNDKEKLNDASKLMAQINWAYGLLMNGET